MPQQSISSVLATADAQLRERMAFILPGDGIAAAAFVRGLGGSLRYSEHDEPPLH